MSDTPLDNFHFDLSAIDLLTNNAINLSQVLEKVTLALEFISDYVSESSEQQDETEDFSFLWEDMILNGIKE